jgi:hypothetical protein
LTPNPILKVLSTLNSQGTRYLLMGGQACVLYGAAEFSRDTDVAVLPEPQNLQRLSAALAELQAECIAIPPFSAEFLARGHAVHFRCAHSDAQRMRIDVMSVMRGLDQFDLLWQRRTTIEEEHVARIEIMSLPDLVKAKKTQRDKDWPMIRRLVEAHFVQHQSNPTTTQVLFWLRESRTPAILIELARRYRDPLPSAVAERPLLSFAQRGDEAGLARALAEEEQQEREADRAYWAPLREELQALRRKRHT